MDINKKITMDILQDFPNMREKIMRLEKERSEAQDECVWLKSENEKLKKRVNELEKGGTDKWKVFTFILLLCLLVCVGQLVSFWGKNGGRTSEGVPCEVQAMIDSLQHVVDSLRQESSRLEEQLVNCGNENTDELIDLRCQISNLQDQIELLQKSKTDVGPVNKYGGYTPRELYKKWKDAESKKEEYKKLLDAQL